MHVKNVFSKFTYGQQHPDIKRQRTLFSIDHHVCCIFSLDLSKAAEGVVNLQMLHRWKNNTHQQEHLYLCIRKSDAIKNTLNLLLIIQISFGYLSTSNPSNKQPLLQIYVQLAAIPTYDNMIILSLAGLITIFADV